MKILMLSLVVLFSTAVFCQYATGPRSGPAYTSDAQLKFPERYRDWVYLSTGFDMSYHPAMPIDRHMFDNVFVNPEAYEAFEATGTWPDKTMLVLEVRGAEGRGSINQRGNYQGTEVMGLEVHVKDEARFPGKWAFFAFDNGRTSQNDSGIRRLLYLPRGTRGCGHHVCPVLSDPAAHRHAQGHPLRLLPEGPRSTGSKVAT